MKRIIILTIFCSLFLITKGFSQQQRYTSFQYAVSKGVGNMAEYISATSFRGALFEYRGVVNDQLMVGIDLGWNVFYEKKDHDSYTYGTETISGVQYRTLNEFPMLISADYLISSASAFKPYVGLGIGTIYTKKSTDMGIYRWQENIWQFALKPELGFLYEISYNTSLKIALKYYNGFKTKNIDKRYKDHLNGIGSEWTKKYKPVKLISSFISSSNFDEDKYTKEYMSKYGIENVRGGSYVSTELDYISILTLQKEIWHSKNSITNRNTISLHT